MESQRTKVINALLKAGDKGLHSFWGYQNYVPRLGAIVFTLKKEGYQIKSVDNKKDSGCTYFLIDVPRVS